MYFVLVVLSRSASGPLLDEDSDIDQQTTVSAFTDITGMDSVGFGIGQVLSCDLSSFSTNFDQGKGMQLGDHLGPSIWLGY